MKQPPSAVLAIHTAAADLSVGLALGDQRYELTIAAAMNHAERLMPAIDSVLAVAETSIAAVAVVGVCGGPGSFTGLRIGYAAAKGLCAAGAHLVSIDTPTTDSWRYRFWPGLVLSVIDARKDRYYAAAFMNGRRLFPTDTVAVDWPSTAILAAIAGILAGAPDDRVDSLPILVVGPDRRRFMAAATGDPAERLVCVEHERPGGAGGLLDLTLAAHGRGDYDTDDSGPFYARTADTIVGGRGAGAP